MSIGKTKVLFAHYERDHWDQLQLGFFVLENTISESGSFFTMLSDYF
jgi:hypothetical protein